ncbi:hypothetical protein, partial [Aneurinibacillus aneurinilyticus]|uniref:hypothetical protein n=1 Tax=Aneurinibacillus aneurinilyticus TaxID=1391 RepID=UPI0023F1782A
WSVWRQGRNRPATVSRPVNTQMFCRSGLGATKRPCLFLVRKRRGNMPTRAPSFFHLMDNQQA